MIALSADEQAQLDGRDGPAPALALRVVKETARILGAERLVRVTCAHADGCLYHGDSGVLFLEHLVSLGGRVRVATSLNVGALDLLHPERVRADPHHRDMSRRLMDAHLALGCRATWTCAPYQAGVRPGLGDQIAWGESNAVAFANSVLGARTNRYGDFLDICAALSGCAPYCGLHVRENRRARVCVDLGRIPPTLLRTEAFYPVLGSWLGRELGTTVAAILGAPADLSEDCLKALGAGAAAAGPVGLFHVVGVTPEAATLEDACQGEPLERRLSLEMEDVRAARDALSNAAGERLDCVCFGSPHFSVEESRSLERALAGRLATVPVYLCTSRATLARLEADGTAASLRGSGVRFVVDTCVVVTPILEQHGRSDGAVMMTNSAKFAYYGKGNTGYATVYGALADCVASAVAGAVTRDESLWR